MPVIITHLAGKPVAQQPLEVVERKGVGHPDSICDAALDAVSVALCREYLRHCGSVLHHNIDKGLLAAGQVEKWFGGGRVVQPMTLYIGDRATTTVDGKTIAVGEIASAAVRDWLREHLRLVDPERDLAIRPLLAPGSAELADIFARPGAMRGANDTSATVGYYPLSPTEQMVLALEQFLNGPTFKQDFPDTGADVKVMAIRRNQELELTVAMPLLAQWIPSEEAYFERKTDILQRLREFVAGSPFPGAALSLNSLDCPGRGLGGVYLSLLGTSAEDGDSGQVGRGNRVNGLIPVNRPIGTEAAAGKNPLSHVGKIYNILAHRMARSIFEGVPGIGEVYVLLASRIGQAIDQPRLAAVQVRTARGSTLAALRQPISRIVEQELAQLDQLCRQLQHGDYPIC